MYLFNYKYRTNNLYNTIILQGNKFITESFKFVYLVMSPASFFFFPTNLSRILCVFQENCTKQKMQ